MFLKRGRDIGTGTSSRNSEVIHAGLYYPTDSLRHQLCVTGRRRLYDYLSVHQVPHKRTGKLIVATSGSQIARLETLLAQGQRNGVEGLRMLSAAESNALEPNLRCVAALLSEETGLIDSHGYMTAVHHELKDHGGAVLLDAPVLSTSILPDGRFRIKVGRT